MGQPQEPSRLLVRMRSMVERLRASRRKHRTRPRAVRVLIVGAGILVVLAGLALTVLPGPAFIVIPIGLALLSLEFVWAERLLDKALDQAAKADRAVNTPAERRLLAAATVLGVLAAVGFGLWWFVFR